MSCPWIKINRVHSGTFIIKVEFSRFCQLDHFDWLLGSEFNNKFAQGFTFIQKILTSKESQNHIQTGD